MANKHKKKKPPVDPHDVVTGKISLSALELIRMIHRVNPTGDGVRSEEAGERYKLKAKLQSLLIRLHSEGLQVEQKDPDQPHLIGIRLRHFAEDACHAFIQELDEDARSWIQRQIDDGNFNNIPNSSSDISSSHRSSFQDQPSPAAEITDKISAEELLDMGKKALEEYDYERCELYYRRAIEKAPGNVESIVSLLDLLVNHLAADEKALDLAKSLSSLVKKGKKVRFLLGLACAHLNRIDPALAWIENLLDPEVAEIYSLCAAHFIKQFDNARASEMLLLLKSCQSSYFASRIVELEKDVKTLHVKSLEPLEDEMTQAWHADDFEKASRLAGRLLSLLPENRAAQKIMIEQKRRAQNSKIDRFMQLADEARRRNDALAEADLLGQAVTAGEDSAASRQRLESLRQEIHRKREKMAVEKVIELWVRGNRTDALLAYTELKPYLRERVQSSLKDPHLHWIEQALSAEISAKTEKIVKAVAVLGESKDALEKGADPQHIVNQIQPHYKVLQSIPLTRQIMQQAEMLIKTKERSKVEGLIIKAQNAIGDNNLELTHELLEQIKVNRLEPDDKNRYDHLNRTLTKLEGIQILRQKYKERLKLGDHVAAREIAGRLAVLNQGEDTAGWREKVEHHSVCIKKEWLLVSADIEEMPVCYELLDLQYFHLLHKSCPLMDGRYLLFASGFDRWIFLKTFCIDDQKFKKAYILRSPKPLYNINITQRGNSIWITSDNCYLLEVSIHPFDVIFAKDYSNLMGEGWICEGEWIFPQNRYLWLNKRDHKGNQEDIIDIIPVGQQRSSRQINCKNSNFPVIVSVGGEFRVALGEWNGRGVRLYSESGKLVDTYTLETSGVLSAATLHPNGSDIVFLSYEDTDSMDTDSTDTEDPENMDYYPLKLEVKPDIVKKNKPIKISGSNGEMQHSICSSLDTGIIYTDFSDQSAKGSHYTLAAWKPSETGLTMLYRIPAPRNFFYACDELSRRVAAVQFSDTKITAVMLDEHPPVLEPDVDNCEDETDIPMTQSFSHWSCSSPTGPLKDTALAFMVQMKDASPSEHPPMISHMKQTAGPDKIAALVLALKLMHDFEESNKLCLWMKETYPDHYTAQLKFAEEAAMGGEWQRVITIVDGIMFEGLDDGTARHLCHLLGIAYFVQGDVETALSTWQKGLTYTDGECDLMPFIKYADFALLSPEQRKEPGTGNISNQLILFEQIDRHVANKDWTTIITIFETEYPVKNADLQILSRLVHAYLNINYEPDNVRWVCKSIVLAYYCACFKDSLKKTFFLPPFIEKWSPARLKDICIDAERWLDAM